MPDFSNWRLLLRKVSLFSSFTQKELQLLAKRVRLVSFAKGAAIVEEGRPGDTFYLIVSGSARLAKKRTDPHGHATDEIVTFVSRGDALGEMSLLTGEPYPITAVAESSVEALVLAKSEFDQLLEQYPSVAVHVSRMLSSHLASLTQGEAQISTPGRVTAVMGAIPSQHQALFGLNLALALVEQTREKVLLVVVDEGSKLVARGLRLESVALTPDDVRDGAFNDRDKFERLISTHPSGLEVLAAPVALISSLELPYLQTLLSRIKELYDHAIILVPPTFNSGLEALLNASNQILFVHSPETDALQAEAVRLADNAMPPQKARDYVWLATRNVPAPKNVSCGRRIPWEDTWGRDFMANGDPFLLSVNGWTRRKLDGLARFLGGRLIGFAMGSGAAFGYSLIGMLRVFEREGIYPDVVSGTSMGALIGAFYAAGMSPDRLSDIARGIDRKALWKMTRVGLPRSGILTGKGVLSFLRDHLGSRTFQDLDIPFACVATDIQTGREIIFDDGDVALGVRASLSLPFFFQPLYHNGRFLVDGGLVNPVPTSVILAQGANVLISANLTSKAADRRVPRVLGWRRRIPSALRGPTIPEILLKTIYTMQYEIAEARAKMAHVVMEIAPQGDLLWWDLDRAQEIMKLGETAAEENISKIKSQLPFFADSCKVRLRHRGRKQY